MVNLVDLGARFCLRNLERNPAIVRRAGARQQPVVMFSLTLGQADWIMIQLYLTEDSSLSAIWLDPLSNRVEATSLPLYLLSAKHG